MTPWQSFRAGYDQIRWHDAAGARREDAMSSDDTALTLEAWNHKIDQLFEDCHLIDDEHMER